ncbi:hypothetical protein ABH920_008811 [Catenulispora sp. EB89]|uniref:YfbM family protein n=1 Tax=Catenulispora sp. EB89 TaxID=3156257 RepID=UPI003515D936
MSLGMHFALDAGDLARLLAANGDDDLAEVFEEIEESPYGEWSMGTDKAWDAIHRCLTDGELLFENGEYPLSHVVLGGRQLHEGDDYIVALVTAEQVVDVAQALERVDEGWTRERFFGLDFDDYDGARDEDDFGYTWTNLDDLRGFYQRAAQARRAVIFTVGL